RTAGMNDPNQTVDEPGRESGAPAPAASTPTHIGRYRVEKVLGQGGFGLVYLAHDEQLQRLLAIKGPHRKLVDRPEAAEAYLTGNCLARQSTCTLWISWEKQGLAQRTTVIIVSDIGMSLACAQESLCFRSVQTL